MQKQIAIVGFAFRLPGTDRSAIWGDLTAGRDLVSRVPESRWAQESYFHPEKSEPGTSYTFAAGTIGDVTGFDAAFFGISPREAAQMDPQQRLLLELTWEAFEHAGVKPSTVRGSRAAVYVGFSGSDYYYRRADDLSSIDASMMTGNTGSIAANRLSYWFDLHGPSMVVDTACSSALVAFHQACQSLRAGESDMAITGAVSLHLHPLAFVGFSKASMLSPSGVCNVFDAAGDGYVRSEGAGIFLLKSLEDAQADGNRIYAVVAGSGSNCDGKTNGLTVPSWESQAALLREVYGQAGIRAADVDYLEAHGTGTAVGDPIETRALGVALGQERPPGRPLPIGSVKSNLGHLETASGVAGLVKAIACLENRTIPPTIHLNKLNPHIKPDEWNLQVVTENTALDSAKKLVIGVNSFGFGGANAHVILQSTDQPQSGPDRVGPPATLWPAPLILSGRGEEALRAAARDYAELLQDTSDKAYYNIAFSAFFHRELHEQRAVLFGLERNAMITSLNAFADGGRAGPVHGEAIASPSRAVFVYSGNGSQWAGMGRVLLAESAEFAAVLEGVDELFARYSEFSLLDNLRRDDLAEALAYTEVAQPLLFAIQVGVTELLRQMGLSPGAVIGHSVGEVAAAWACGALTLEQAVRVILERSSKQGGTKGNGGMVAVGLGEAAARDLLADLAEGESLAIAGINSPRGVTVAGPVDALVALESLLTQREVFFRRLALDYAFHSTAMDPLQKPIEQSLSGLRPVVGKIPFYSTVTGGRLSGDRLDEHYWWRNIREPVLFANAIKGLVADGFNVFVEIGPHAVLRNYVDDGLRAEGLNGQVITTLLRDDAALERVQGAFCQALISGTAVDLSCLFPKRGRFVDVPGYPWQREAYWHTLTTEGYDLINRRKEHPLLGYRLHENAASWENHIDATLYPELGDHRVGEAVVFPAAGYAELAIAASSAWTAAETCEFEELEIRAPLLLEPGSSKTLRFTIDENDGRFRITSRGRLSEEPWLLNAEGRLLGTAFRTEMAPGCLPTRSPDFSGTEHYSLTDQVGLAYGPVFQSVSDVWVCEDQVWARLAPSNANVGGFTATLLNPASLDGAFQLLVDLFAEQIGVHGNAAFVPVKIGRLVLYHKGVTVHMAEARLIRRSPRSVLCGFTLYDAEGGVVAVLEDVRFRALQLRRPAVAPTGYLRFHAIAKPNAAERGAAVLPRMEQFVDVCNGQLHAAQRMALRRRYYDEVEPLLDALCAAFVREALEGLEQTGELLAPGDMLGAGLIAPEQQPLFRRMLQMLEEDGLVEPVVGDGWRWSIEAEFPAASDIWVSLLGDYPDYAAEVSMTGRVGMHLAEGLGDPGRAAQLVPQGCSNATLAHFLGASPSLAEVNRAVGGMVNLAMSALPEGKRLHIIELTSCRSQLSAHVLPHIDPDRCDYLIGALTEELVSELEPLQGRYPDIEIRPLDFLRPGVEPFWNAEGGFDLVLLANELADAEHAEQLVANLATLVAPGGLVVLVEQRPSRWADLVFGLQSRWWGPGDQTAPVSRLRSARFWSQLLEKYGFSDVSEVQDLPDVASGPYLLLARASEQRIAIPDACSADQELWVLVQDAEGYSSVLSDLMATQMRASGRRVVTASAGEAFTADGPEAYGLDISATGEFEHLIHTVRMRHGEINGCVFLQGVRLPADASREDDVMARATQRCWTLTALLQACSSAGIQPQLAVVTAQGAFALSHGEVGERPVMGDASSFGDGADTALWGLARTAINEYPELRMRLLDLAEPDAVNLMADGLVRELLHPDAEDELILTGAGRYVPRVRAVSVQSSPQRPDDEEADELVRLDFSRPGPLKNLHWRRLTLADLPGDQVEIEVRAAGLNFRDVMYAMGLLSDEALEQGFSGPSLGMELAGVVTRVGAEVRELQVGEAVIAFAPASFATRASTPASAVVHKPEGWSFEAAATVPTTFFTAYYALHHLAGLQPGERVLIHGAAGGVGIAAIQLAKYLGAEIFATAGSEEKRDFVRLLGADHVMDSRSLAFADETLRITQGEGVDVVLNSLAGEAINRNLRVLKPFGRFLELGKRDFYENTRIGLRPFRNNITYYGIDADQLMFERPALTRRLFKDLMDLFAQGALKPLPYRAFAANDVVDAFRYMQQSKQIGKVVLSFRDGVLATEPDSGQNEGLALLAGATYLVTGGLSGFGLKTAEWLAAKGARNLLLLSRSGRADDSGQEVISGLERSGVQVHVAACDVADRKALFSLLSDIEAQLPPLRGIIHAAMVIDDGLLRGMSAERLERVFTPKILGAGNLHKWSLERDLDFFVLYSSATTLFGNPGQANYVAANCYLEGLANARRAQGLPALCVSWGAIGDVGYLARNPEIQEALVSRMGGAALSADDALGVLERLLMADSPSVSVLDLEWNKLQRFLPSATAPKYRFLAREAEEAEGDADLLADLQRWVEELSPEELHEVLVDLLKREVGEILRIAPEKLDEQRSLYDLGMDSLMGLELISALETRLGVVLPIMALSEGPTIAMLAERLIRQLKGGGDALASQIEQTGTLHGVDIAAEVGEDKAHEVMQEIAAALDTESGSQARPLLKRS